MNVSEYKEIKFKAVDKPDVSIIIPVYNQIEYTLECLKSIYQAKNELTYEIIVIDDQSTDETNTILSKIEGINYIRNEVNLGFVKNINNAAKESKGEFLFLLNNDTKVTDGFLDSSKKLFDEKENVACVGSKLIYPDGTLQEAGSHLSTTAHGFNYGKGEDPNDFRFNYVREVDYCSAAALMIRAKIFFELKMLDEELAPAYYDDSDFQVRARKAGYKNLYQPLSVVYHYEGTSYGKEVAGELKGLKKYQEINRLKFLKKHSDFLKANAYTEGVGTNDRNIFAKEKPHIFFFESSLLTPDSDSGSLRCFNLLKLLNQSFYVTFFLVEQTYDKKYYDLLTQEGIRVAINPNSDKEVDVFDFVEKEADLPKHIVLSRPKTGAYFFRRLKAILGNRAKFIYDTVDLHFVRIKSQIASLKAPATEDLNEFNFLRAQAKNFRAVESYLAENCDELWAVTTEEKVYAMKAHLKEESNIKVVPNIYNSNKLANSFESRKDMLFIGGFSHPPNVQAINYYVEAIIPELKRRKVNAKLNVVGSKSHLLNVENSEYLEVIGFVEDVEPWFNNSLMAFYPLITGAGMKGKITQALALGLPVVTTDYGEQGYENAHEYMLVGYSPKELVDLIEQLTGDKELWEKCRENGVKFIDKNLSSDAVSKELEYLLK